MWTIDFSQILILLTYKDSTITCRGLSDATGISKSVCSVLLNGQPFSISAKNLLLLLDYLECEPNEILIKK